MSRFAELHTISNFSFLRGASHPEELVLRAAELGYEAIAITDECSYAGIVRAHMTAQELEKAGQPIKLIIGSEFRIHADAKSEDEAEIHLILLSPNRSAYSEISALISRARRRSDKGSYRLHLQDLQFGTQHCLAIWLPPQGSSGQLPHYAQQLAGFFKERLWLGLALLQGPDDQQYYFHCQSWADHLKIPMVACNNVHMHDAARKPLQDVLTAIRLGKSVQELGREKQSNGEGHLRPIPVLQEKGDTRERGQIYFPVSSIWAGGRTNAHGSTLVWLTTVYAGYVLFVMAPESENFHHSLVLEHLVDQAVLNIDAA